MSDWRAWHRRGSRAASYGDAHEAGPTGRAPTSRRPAVASGAGVSARVGRPAFGRRRERAHAAADPGPARRAAADRALGDPAVDDPGREPAVDRARGGAG